MTSPLLLDGIGTRRAILGGWERGEHKTGSDTTIAAYLPTSCSYCVCSLFFSLPLFFSLGLGLPPFFVCWAL